MRDSVIYSVIFLMLSKESNSETKFDLINKKSTCDFIYSIL